jgi:hypothetical protein
MCAACNTFIGIRFPLFPATLGQAVEELPLDRIPKMPYIGGQSPGVRISPGQATIAVHVLVLSIADSGICPAWKSSLKEAKKPVSSTRGRVPHH